MNLAADDMDTLRSGVMLMAAVIGLIAAVLSLLNVHLKEAGTPDERQGIYRRFFSRMLKWTEMGLWIAGMALGMILIDGAKWTLGAWMAAYALCIYHFLASDDESRLRAEIVKLVFSGLAVLFMVMIVVAERFLLLFGGLLKALGG